jgi:predicted amidohydrolase
LDILTIGIAQIAPVWLDRNAAVAKVAAATGEAARRHT